MFKIFIIKQIFRIIDARIANYRELRDMLYSYKDIAGSKQYQARMNALNDLKCELRNLYKTIKI
jgi:hypothetical protein